MNVFGCTNVRNTHLIWTDSNNGAWKDRVSF